MLAMNQAEKPPLTRVFCRTAIDLAISGPIMKAAEDCRSPRRWRTVRKRFVVAELLDCGSPLPLFLTSTALLTLLWLLIGAVARSADLAPSASVAGSNSGGGSSEFRRGGGVGRGGGKE